MRRTAVHTLASPAHEAVAPAADAILERGVTRARTAVRAGRHGYARFVLARSLMAAQRIPAEDE